MSQSLMVNKERMNNTAHNVASRYVVVSYVYLQMNLWKLLWNRVLFSIFQQDDERAVAEIQKEAQEARVQQGAYSDWTVITVNIP